MRATISPSPWRMALPRTMARRTRCETYLSRAWLRGFSVSNELPICFGPAALQRHGEVAGMHKEVLAVLAQELNVTGLSGREYAEPLAKTQDSPCILLNRERAEIC